MTMANIVELVCLIICLYLTSTESFRLCTPWERCDDCWISTEFKELGSTLRNKVYGQHLIHGPVLQHVKAHAQRPPSKALVLSFHGSSGTGKNYVSKLLVEGIYSSGFSSQFVHLISAIKEFPHDAYLQQYKDTLKNLIETSVRACPRSFFIFDEMHQMPEGLIDTIKPYVDFHDKLDGVDYRMATFIFLSNIAANEISNKTVEHWKTTLDREQIRLKDMEEAISLAAYNSERGLFRSSLVAEGLITAYIPFLPLERRHVKECIRDALVARGYYKHADDVSEVKVQEVADELTYYPKDISLYSVYGCKRILQKVDLAMSDIHTEL